LKEKRKGKGRRKKEEGRRKEGGKKERKKPSSPSFEAYFSTRGFPYFRT
jgi:hypothetical protein